MKAIAACSVGPGLATAVAPPAQSSSRRRLATSAQDACSPQSATTRSNKSDSPPRGWWRCLTCTWKAKERGSEWERAEEGGRDSRSSLTGRAGRTCKRPIPTHTLPSHTHHLAAYAYHIVKKMHTPFELAHSDLLEERRKDQEICGRIVEQREGRTREDVNASAPTLRPSPRPRTKSSQCICSAVRAPQDDAEPPRACHTDAAFRRRCSRRRY